MPGMFRFIRHARTVTTAAFNVFLRNLMAAHSHAVCRPFDGRPTHNSPLVREFGKRHMARLTQGLLPPDLPEYYADGLVRDRRKRAAAKAQTGTNGEINADVVSVMRRRQKHLFPVASPLHCSRPPRLFMRRTSSQKREWDRRRTIRFQRRLG